MDDRIEMLHVLRRIPFAFQQRQSLTWRQINSIAVQYHTIHHALCDRRLWSVTIDSLRCNYDDPIICGLHVEASIATFSSGSD
ncbi:hypothetical protein CEXT_439831 [Caerostris extrusa]|uniref:Uncharacterized protein n=1 Tax=Caerostris extrusa TaxID=172846 RepID=A0AAV4Y013_CAEEX|nr:hypothetical protein CEXT_439831 [Caerostris extrusa]